MIRKFLTAALCLTVAAVLYGCPEDKSKAIASSKISYDLGVNYLSGNQARQALQEFLKAVKENPDFPEAHYALGLIYFGMKDYKQAEEHYKIAIELKQDYSEAQNSLGRLYIDLEKYDSAIEQFKKALSNMLYRTPQYATANLGWALYKKGMYKEALEQFRKTVSIDPKFCLAYRSIGLIQMELGEALEALRAFEKFRESCQPDAEGPYRLAEVKRKFKLATNTEIIADLEKALDLDQSYCPARLMLGVIQDESSHIKDAQETMEKYFESCHETAEADAYKLMGTLYSKAGQEAKAVAYFHVCAKKWPETVTGKACKLLIPNQ